ESDVASRGEKIGIRAIERFHEWVRDAADDEAINAPPASTRAFRVEAGVVIIRRMVVLEGKLLDGRSAHVEVEAAAEEQQGVVVRLGVEPLRIHAPEETIVGVDLGCRSSRRKEALILLARLCARGSPCRYAALVNMSRCNFLSDSP